jgi:hypothetical protein
VDIRTVGDEVTVQVSKGVDQLPGLTVSGRALAVLEPGVLIGGSPEAEPGAASGPP